MIITFCGHSDFNKDENTYYRIVSYLKKLAENNPVEFYLGNYGSFDYFAENCCLEVKKTYPDVKLIFVSPYQTETYLKSRTEYHRFDEIIYPEIETVPKKYAIVYRNKYMIDAAEIIIAYVNNHIASNSYKLIKYAERKNKIVVNFATNRL